MPLPALAVAAAPYALDFITGLLGGKKRGESPEAIFQRNYAKYLAMMPKLDTSGLQARAMAGYDQSARGTNALRNQRFRQMLGPRAFSANEAAGGGQDIANRSKFLFGTASDINRMGFDANMQRSNAAAGIASGITNPQQDYSTQRNLLDRSLGLVTSGASNRLDQQRQIDYLKKLGLLNA
jgi:hypothetical protein